jgi:threonine aldolase
MKSFGSDNHSGAHPRVLQAIAAANEGHAVAYGDDPLTAGVEACFRELFGDSAEVFFVFNGTGANVLALSCITDSYGAVVCSSTAHIWTDECGAPEKQCGCKLLPVDTSDGKLTPALVEGHLHGFGAPHHSQPQAISISQPTELGTLYTVDEIRALAELAHRHGIKLHVDGARLANALAATGATPHEMITATGVDALSFGGTKNGMVGGEAVVFPAGGMADAAPYRRKQSMQLPSKMRFVAAQFDAVLRDGLWLRMAAHSNAMARLLAGGAAQIPGVELTRKVQVNGVFARLPQDAIARLQEHYFFYVWNEERREVRWMTSFDTTERDVEEFLGKIRGVVING